MSKTIIVEVTVNASVKKVWEMWKEPRDIMKWCHASEDWHAPAAKNNLKVGGRFKTKMEAKDGSTGFEFEGVYTEVVPLQEIEYTIMGNDRRKVRVEFIEDGKKTKVVETFEPENENPVEMQKEGWQAILNNFKKHVESH